MAEKNLRYFMRDNTEEVITVPGPDSFKDENGKVINLEIKVLMQKDLDRIRNNYRKHSVATDKRGNPLAYNGEVLWKTEKDNDRTTRHIIVEALKYPNLKDKELMEFYHCADVTEMPRLVFSRSDEYSFVTRAVLKALGIIEDESDNEIVNEAKN
ncbi:MAG: hypothetical protein LUC92_08665 [Clostridiales bacterium]|nr:hypothetical protein [Clostridiales bacterium]